MLSVVSPPARARLNPESRGVEGVEGCAAVGLDGVTVIAFSANAADVGCGYRRGRA